MTKTRVALVTGGGSGMGEASCYRLARDAKSIAVLDINSAQAQKVAAAINDAGGSAISVTADITCRKRVESAIETVREPLGPINSLVNCAGMEHFAAFDVIDSEHWDRMLDINLKGNYNVTQAVLPDMVAARWGRIINFSSVGAQTGAAHMVHYAAAVAFFASEDAGCITAQVLGINGGTAV